jgi:hypothetical protein
MPPALNVTAGPPPALSTSLSGLKASSTAAPPALARTLLRLVATLVHARSRPARSGGSTSGTRKRPAAGSASSIVRRTVPSYAVSVSSSSPPLASLRSWALIRAPAVDTLPGSTA